MKLWSNIFLFIIFFDSYPMSHHKKWLKMGQIDSIKIAGHYIGMPDNKNEYVDVKRQHLLKIFIFFTSMILKRCFLRMLFFNGCERFLKDCFIEKL